MKKDKKKKKGSFSGIILILVFLIGLSLLLYPTISDYWNSRVQSKVINEYEITQAAMTDDERAELFAQADDYNSQIRKIDFPFMNYSQVPGYYDILDIAGNGVIGYVSIDKIKVELPIYHGTSAPVLNVAAGHLEGSSLPVGGESTHAVISAHRGLPSAKLFTNLDDLEIGDTFQITVLDRVLTYQIDQVVIVEPTQIEELYIAEGEDYCTLMTCTPYGINTHRLFVRGKRIDTPTQKADVYVKSEAFLIDPIIVTPVVIAPMLLILLVILLVRTSVKKGGKKKNGNDDQVSINSDDES